MRFTRYLLLPAMSGLSLLRGAPAFPLQDGEHLSYRVSFALVMGAGEIKIDAHQDPAAKEPHLLVTAKTATKGLARLLMRFDAQAESMFDLRTGKLISLHETNTTRGKKAEHEVVFDYAAHQATYSVPESDEKPRNLTLPDGDPLDLIMGLLQTRSWNLKPGQSRDALVLFDDDFYQLTIHALRYEDVKTKLGMFKTLVLEPRMDKTEPKGMFKRGSAIHVWIAEDSHRLPVKFEVEFKIGTGTATLDAYGPPTGQSGETGTPKADAANDSPSAPAKQDEKNPRP